LTSKNILIEHDTVSGYDAGSVLDGTYSTHKLIATDRDGPTGRVKFGTEGTSGLDTVTIRNMVFDRSRGFALESVDGAELKNVLFTDIRMKHISSSPIFIVLGDRARAPVTGIGADDAVNAANNIRLNDTGWVLPNNSEYGNYPAVRYMPSYDKSAVVPIGGASHPFTIVNPVAPTRLNPSSSKPGDPRFANAVGAGFARVHNIVIRNVVVEDADPRYPILLSGLVDHPIEDIAIDNVAVEFRGGLKMEHAVEQRQLNRAHPYAAYQRAPATQSLPWLVNTFFSKNEALLPRVGWDAAVNDGQGGWSPDPYNVPEMTREYPEPSMLGILPAYGIYARHVKSLNASGVRIKYKAADERPAIVLDDVADSRFTRLAVTNAPGVPAIVEVTNTRKREADLEYVKEIPYKTTTVSHVELPVALRVKQIVIDRPSPGTPPDSLYKLPTAPSAQHPYAYSIPDDNYPLPLTVYRPCFDFISPKTVVAGLSLHFTVAASTAAADAKLKYSATGLPAGANFDLKSGEFSWTPNALQTGTHTVVFIVNDGVMPESTSVRITVLPATKH
ncbi:MAG: putative Ig domain-containing protein, partial [Terracidiphilus sp.]